MYGFKNPPVLSEGKHGSPEEGMCIMELISFTNREPFSDSPKCTDDRIAVYMQNMNDTVTDKERVKLLSVLDRMFHTGNMTANQHANYELGLRTLWPELRGMVKDEQTHENFDFRDNIISSIYTADPAVFSEIWRFLYDVSLEDESVDVKLAVLNKVLDVMDAAMGVTETLPQNREEIEKMLEKVDAVR